MSFEGFNQQIERVYKSI